MDIIEEYLDSLNVFDTNNINYSKIEFNIKTNKCSECSVDGYMVILDNPELFDIFINLNSIYIDRIFNMYKNIINL